MRSLAILVLTVTFVAHFCLNHALRRASSCPKKCRLTYAPVCGIRFVSETPNRCTFVNLCLMVMYICKTKQKWLTMSLEVCQDHSPNCSVMVSYFRNHSELLSHESLDFDILE